MLYYTTFAIPNSLVFVAHPDPTIHPMKLKDYEKQLKAYYGWKPEEFLKATQENAYDD